MPETNLPMLDHSELTDAELHDLTASPSTNPDWAVISIRTTSDHPVELHAHTRRDAQVLADVLNAGWLHASPQEKHYVVIPTNKLDIVQ